MLEECDVNELEAEASSSSSTNNHNIGNEKTNDDDGSDNDSLFDFDDDVPLTLLEHARITEFVKVFRLLMALAKLSLQQMLLASNSESTDSGNAAVDTTTADVAAPEASCVESLMSPVQWVEELLCVWSAVRDRVAEVGASLYPTHNISELLAAATEAKPVFIVSVASLCIVVVSVAE